MGRTLQPLRILRSLTIASALAVLCGAGLGAQTQATTEPFVHHDLYPEAADAGKDVATALQQARRQHKRVLMVFGGNWCGDCVVLNMKLHDATNAELLARSYVLVHVNVGHMDENVELAQRYGVPLTHGVPGVSVVDANGKVVHAQPNGNLADVRHMDSHTVNEFLKQWKG